MASCPLSIAISLDRILFLRLSIYLAYYLFFTNSTGSKIIITYIYMSKRTFYIYTFFYFTLLSQIISPLVIVCTDYVYII